MFVGFNMNGEVIFDGDDLIRLAGSLELIQDGTCFGDTMVIDKDQIDRIDAPTPVVVAGIVSWQWKPVYTREIK